MKNPVLSSCVSLIILLSSASLMHTAIAHPYADLYYDGIYLEFGDNRGYRDGYYDYGYPYPYRYGYPNYRYPPTFIYRPYHYFPDYRNHHHHRPYKWHTRPRKWKH